MKKLGLGIVIITFIAIGNLTYQLFTKQEYGKAFERTWFQLSAIVAYLLAESMIDPD